MLVQLLLQVHLAHSCLSKLTILSGTRTLYDSGNDVYVPAVILPPHLVSPIWLYDPEAKWVWWIADWIAGTFHFVDSFGLAQWAVEKVNTAVLKIVADDYYKVMFNGETLKDLESGQRQFSRFFEYNLKGKLKGSSAGEYLKNELDVVVETENPSHYEGLMYRIEIIFS